MLWHLLAQQELLWQQRLELHLSMKWMKSIVFYQESKEKRENEITQYNFFSCFYGFSYFVL